MTKDELKEKLLRKESQSYEWYKCSSFEGISIQKVIVVSLIVGEGTDEDPLHLVDVFYNEEGRRIFAVDKATGDSWKSQECV